MGSELILIPRGIARAAAALEVVGRTSGKPVQLPSGTVFVWPFGTETVDDDPLTIKIPHNGTFALGDNVTVGGGYVLEHSSTTREAAPFEVAGVTVPTACAEHDIFLAT